MYSRTLLQESTLNHGISAQAHIKAFPDDHVPLVRTDFPRLFDQAEFVHYRSYGQLRRRIFGQVQTVERPLGCALADSQAPRDRGQDWPCALRRAIVEASTASRGRPSCLPFAAAFRKPARTGSRMQSLSNSAKAEIIW
jgi:hypothetical protein